MRNYLLKEAQTDYLDLATEAYPEDVMKWGFENNIRVIPSGLKHGTVTLIWNNETIEITTLRQDIETDGRHAVVCFSKDWSLDAKRRDFTMNALYINKWGEIEDYVGGVADLKKRKLSFVGQADQRIKEDYLRVWRYYRFLALYGDEQYHESFSLGDYKSGLRTLSRERVLRELLKWMSAKKTKTEYAKELFRAQFDCDISDDLEIFEQASSFALPLPEPVLPLFKICLLFKEKIPDLAWSNSQKRYFKHFFEAIKEHNAQYVIQKFGYEIALSWALFRGLPFQELEIFPLKGGDLKDFVNPTHISQKLEKVLKWWCAQASPRPSKEACLDFVTRQR